MTPFLNTIILRGSPWHFRVTSLGYSKHLEIRDTLPLQLRQEHHQRKPKMIN